MNHGTRSHGFMTRLVHAGEAADPAWGAVGVPMYQNTTFAFPSAADIDALNAGEQEHYVYSRYSNPTVTALGTRLPIWRVPLRRWQWRQRWLRSRQPRCRSRQ